MLNLKKLTLQGGRTTEYDVLSSKSLKENVKIKLYSDNGYICQLKNITTSWTKVWTPFGANHLISLARSQKELRKMTLVILDPQIKYPIDMIKPMLSYADQLAEIKIICRNGLRIRFNEKDYEEILKVVDNRNNGINLNINITSTIYLSGMWEKEEIIIFNDESNHLNVISHYAICLVGIINYNSIKSFIVSF